MFIIILFGIKQLKKLWKKTFKNIYQLSCFVGHPVLLCRFKICITKLFLIYVFQIWMSSRFYLLL